LLAVVKRQRHLTYFLLTGLGATARWWLYVGTDANETTSYFALLCLLTGCLGIYLLMRFAETIKRSGRNLWMVTDISDTSVECQVSFAMLLSLLQAGKGHQAKSLRRFFKLGALACTSAF